MARCAIDINAQKQDQNNLRLLLINTAIIAEKGHFLNRYFRRTGPGLSTKISDSTSQDTAKMLQQVSHLGFLPDTNLTLLLIVAYMVLFFWYLNCISLSYDNLVLIPNFH